MTLRALRLALASVATFLVLSAPLMGFFHAVVPHTDPVHSAFHDALWEGLNGSLSQKELVAVVPAAFILLVLLEGFFVMRVRPARAPFHEPSLRLALRRGILQYRRFG